MTFVHTWNQPSLLEVPDKDLLMPGEDGKIIFNLMKRMVMEKNQKFTLRDGGVTLGYGVISEILPDRDPEELEKTRKAIKKERKKAEEAAQGF